jgi:DNA-binding CsgD family transcriptional regulator
MEIFEGLFDLDPVRSYARRGAERLMELAGASGFRLELGADVHLSEPPPSGPAAVALPIRVGAEELGTLHLYGSPPSEEDMGLLRWGSRILARGIRYARRIDGNSAQRTYEDVQAMLEKTPLTPRERDVVGRLLSGASTRQIADNTGLTVATVNTYLKRIFAKLGVHSRVELVARVTGTRGVVPAVHGKSESSQP